MPVTKKKGAIFAIYADSPVRGGEVPESRQTVAKLRTIQPPVKAEPGSTRRKALTSLHPVPVARPLGTRDAGLSGAKSNILSDKVAAADVQGGKGQLGEVSKAQKTAKPISNAGQGENTSRVTSRGKSAFSVFSDHPSREEKSITNGLDTAHSTVERSARKPLSGPHPILGLAPPAQPTKRTRDLLSPLPIVPRGHSHTHHSASATAHVRPADTEDDAHPSIGQSPAKRTKPSPRQPLQTQRTHTQRTDKENLPPCPTSPDDLGGSPATRTRSKIRALSLAESPSGPSPLRVRSSITTSATFGAAPSADAGSTMRRTGRLLGDGRGTLTLKKGRELATLMNDSWAEERAGDIDAAPRLKGMTASLGSEPSVKGQRQSKKTSEPVFGLAHRVRPDGALADVSEAYGANGEEPSGFRTQRVSGSRGRGSGSGCEGSYERR
ncbi:hypothetical protein IAU60_002073 [Kwoniella sp. DSM 27419]